MPPASLAPGAGARPSLRRLAFWLPVLLAVFLMGAALFIAGVSLSVIRLADNAGEDSAPRLMEELRAVGNLERLVALGDQFAAERDPAQARRTALTMQALALHPSVATLSQRHQDVRSTFELMTELQMLREQQLAAGTTPEMSAVLDATLQQRWHAQRLVLKDIADRTAVDLVNRTTETGRDISRSAHDILVTTAFGALVGLTTCLLLLLVVRRYFLAPLLAVSAYLTSLRNGIEPSQALPDPNTQEMADVMRIAGDLAQAQAALETLALRDQLTGLANRHALDARLDQSLARARRNGHRLALLFIDIDRFKSINDTLGHATGDEFLKVMANRLSDCVRDADTVARLGGDEFIIVIDVPGEVNVAADVARKLLEALMQPVQLDSLELKSSASMGISLFPDDGETRGELMKNADLAMYHAKSVGRNNFQFFDASMNEAINAKLRLETELRAGLAHGEMVLHFQPQVEGASGRLCGFEALVRWQPPGRPLVGPGEFIALAEETGLIGPLGDWVLAQACATLADWHRRGWTGIRMAINLSARQLKDHTLPERVSQHLQQHRLPPQAIELEVTESVAMDDPEMSIRNLRALKTLGLTLAIDDFGTGYSSLAYLKLLPIDRLKLDRTFVRDIGIDPNDDVISAATIALAHSLRLELVAEGVETEGQRTFLAQQGCDTMQGYLFGKPMPADEALARIEKELPPAPV